MRACCCYSSLPGQRHGTAMCVLPWKLCRDPVVALSLRRDPCLKMLHAQLKEGCVLARVLRAPATSEPLKGLCLWRRAWGALAWVDGSAHPSIHPQCYSAHSFKEMEVAGAEAGDGAACSHSSRWPGIAATWERPLGCQTWQPWEAALA